MGIRRFALAVAGLSLVAGAAMTSQASAQVTAEACSLEIGAVNTAGQASAYKVWATKPLQEIQLEPYKLFGVRASATWYYVENTPKKHHRGLVLQGGNLYAAYSTYSPSGTAASAVKLGSGWSGFSTIATSNYVQGPKAHRFLYGLHANGSLYRYNYTTGAVRAFGSAPGYQAFKTITVISETATYDTLLATTKAGALWTIHIPVTAPFKATLKQVRSTGFAAYDQLVVQRCGTSSMLLVGMNNTANTGTMYAVSRANGSATLINTIGTFAATFDAPTYFLRTRADGPQLVGE